jgi:hypothetical protein
MFKKVTSINVFSDKSKSFDYRYRYSTLLRSESVYR